MTGGRASVLDVLDATTTICPGCGRADCPLPAARAAYGADKAVPVGNVLLAAESDCDIARRAAWERYLAERTTPPAAMPDGFRISYLWDEAEVVLQISGPPAASVYLGSIERASAVGRALAAWAEQQKPAVVQTARAVSS